MPMTPERWQQIEKLFHAALELKARERAAFLEEACGNDESLRREVESLLGQKEKPEGFMTIPVVDQAIRLIAADEDATGPELEIDQRKTPPPPESQETGTLQFAQDHRPGEFGHYRIVRLLGKGGMGEVYEAEDLESGRRVALKILSQSMTQPVDKARFLREGRLAASISHPHCVYVYGTEEIQGTSCDHDGARARGNAERSSQGQRAAGSNRGGRRYPASHFGSGGRGGGRYPASGRQAIELFHRE